MKAFAQTILIAAALMTTNMAGAAVYKYIDENGNVAYGDKPVDGSKKIKIQSTRNLSPESEAAEDSTEQTTKRDSTPAELDERTDEEAAAATVYKSLIVLTPKPDKEISGSSGSVQVIFLPTPTLARDDQLVISVDGKDISKGRDANVSLKDLSLGSHNVQGRIMDSDGKLKIQSDSVTFHVKD